MADLETRSGQASDWETPYPERARLKVGGRSVWVYRFKKDSEDPNPEYEQLQNAANQGLWVKVTVGVYNGQTRDGKPYKSFTAYDVQFLASEASSMGNGSGPVSPTTAGKADNGITSGRPAPVTDRVLWALDRAVDLSIAQGATGVPESFLSLPLEEKAKYLLGISAQLVIENTFTEEKPKAPAKDTENSEEMKDAFA